MRTPNRTIFGAVMRVEGEPTRVADRDGRRRRAVRCFYAVPAIAFAALASGFLWFAFHIASEEEPPERAADGIVALTGGADRITDAVGLLAAGWGRRLLITGVGPTTNTAELVRLAAPDHQRWFRCCVDLDYAAVNTVGNAAETKRWARARGFRSLVVVTSGYHMPRAMLEISHRLPDVTLIPFPVVTERHAEPWWSSPGTAKILVFEYLKYIVAAARIGLEPASDVAEIEPGRRAGL